MEWVTRPFSSLAHSIQFPLKGIDIKLDGRDISVETIQPLKYNKGRFISLHMMYFGIEMN